MYICTYVVTANRILYVGLRDRERKDIWHMRMKVPLKHELFVSAWQPLGIFRVDDDGTFISIEDMRMYAFLTS